MLDISNYQLEQTLYEGTSSIIYRARGQDKQTLILKTIRANYPTPFDLVRYRQEYEIIQGLDSPHVVKTFGLIQHQNTLALLLEDFQATSLKTLAHAHPFELSQFLPLAIQMVTGLGQIHAEKVIHKDVNPANIILNPTTGQLKWIDFGISTQLSTENTTLKHPRVLEGTLAYISPEQTGRMNRVIDYRTDFYSLGVTFYELLTGRLPFMSDDALELLHSHIARQPIPPHKINPHIPPILSEIILKLMAKNAEDRYQSAWGLRHDLERVMELGVRSQELGVRSQELGVRSQELGVRRQEAGVRDSQFLVPNSQFQLGAQDISGQFHIPQKLYGREKEIEILLQTFARVAQPVETGHALSLQTSEMLLVSGYSGVGKSALVHEVHKPMTEKRGYFITGKYDQYQRNMPYYALSQALNDFCHQILTESAESLASWRARILAAVGSNGQVLLEVAPSLELIIGAQPAVVEVGPQEAQNRFNVVLQAFIQVLSQPQHPLIMFIDDLQWADLASLHALRSLLEQTEIKHCFIIGAYRDNEVDSSHPLMVTLREMRKNNVIVNELRLANLTEADVHHLVADTLQSENSGDLLALSNLIYSKTLGNAFFTTEFLKSLYEQGLLTFVRNTPTQPSPVTGEGKGGGWQWDMTRLTALNITDNVVLLLAEKLNKMSAEVRAALQLAACIGNQFDLRILAIIAEQTPSQMLTTIWAAIQENLLIPLDDNYRLWQVMADSSEPLAAWFKFSHDRIQQAAYSLIEEAARPTVHLRIGRLLLAHISPQEQDTFIFDIVNQWNEGRALLATETEQLALARLNLQAAQKAKAAIAYQPATEYLEIALTLLPANPWGSQPDLTFELYREAAECHYLATHFERASELFATLFAQVRDPLKLAAIYLLQMKQFSTQARYQEAIETGFKGLSLLGLAMPSPADKVALQAAFDVELAEYNRLLNGRPIADFIDLPEMTDPVRIAALRLIANLSDPTIVFNEDAFNLVSIKGVNLCLQHGNSYLSSLVYVLLGIILISKFNDYRNGYALAKFGIRLNDERFPYPPIVAKNLAYFEWNINHWGNHARANVELSKRTYQAGMAASDVLYTAYTLVTPPVNLLFIGAPLSEVIHAADQCIDFSTKYEILFAAVLGQQIKQLALCLQGETEALTFNNTQFQEAAFMEAWREVPVVLEHFDVRKLQALYLLEAYPAALAVISAHTWEHLLSSYIQKIQFHFYHALTKLAVPQAWEDEAFAASRQWLRELATISEPNVLHKHLLVEAEYARVTHDVPTAIKQYQAAIASAKQHDFGQNQALAHELYAQFWLELGETETAQIHLRHAIALYLRWGATAKVTQLHHKHHTLLHVSAASHGHLLTTTGHTTQSRQALDLNAVMKAAQAISSEIELETLLTTLMQIVLQTAGAERSLLLLPKAGQWGVKAVGSINNDSFKVNILATVLLDNATLHPETRLSLAIVNYVIHTQAVVVLSDASHEEMFQRDDYVREYKPKSVLCIPLLKQGELVGLVYLENNVAVGAFTPEQVKLLELLAAQAAISLDNAQLLAERQETIVKLQEIDQLKTEFLTTMSHELRTPLNSILGFSDLLIQGIYGDLPDMAMNDIQVIHNSGQYLLAIINDILDITKIEAGLMEIVPEPIEAAEVVTEVINAASSLVQHKPIVLKSHLAEDLPLIEADKTRLKQILLNLIDNAIKFTAQGEVTIEVGVQNVETLPAHFMEFAVKDTGIGIPLDKQALIFEAFHQVDMSRTRSYGGTGLGLTICQRLVMMHGGRIWVESELGRGTTVKFTVKLASLN